MIRKFSTYIFLCFLLFFSACKKKTKAGFGGNANLKITGQHHGQIIDSITMYVLFNSSEIPENGQYDYQIKATTLGTNNSYALIKGLKSGDYYLYAQGWDPSISNAVKGGIPFTIDQEKDYEIIIPVTEQH